MNAYGIFICDGCERPINRANIIPTLFRKDGTEKEFTFAFCPSCDRIDVHRTVLTKAAREFSEWIQKKNP